MAANKTQVLVNTLEKNQEVFGSDPDEYLGPSPEMIEREIENRERVDAELRFERQQEIDQMFPDRVQGALYEKQTIEFESFDF